MTLETIPLDEARRIAIAAQGLHRPRLRRAATAADLRRIIGELGLVQLDYVNVLLPAHYQIFYSRLGPYRRELFERVVYGGREFTEQWAHEASVIPVSTRPLLRHRMEERRIWRSGFDAFIEEHPDYCEWVMEEIRRRGPSAADDLEVLLGSGPEARGVAVRDHPAGCAEMHFMRGRLAVVERRQSLARVFDLAERALPAEWLESRVAREDAERTAVLTAARAYGIATAADLADYWRSPAREAQPRIAELVSAGLLHEVRVEGWKQAAFLDPLARVPREVGASTLLAPFDPLVWFRPRTERLWGFEYRFESSRRRRSGGGARTCCRS